MDIDATFPGFAILQICIKGSSDSSHCPPICIALQRYTIISNVAALRVIRYAFPLQSESFERMWSLRAPPAGTATAKTTSTTVTPTSARDVAVASVSGCGEADVGRRRLRRCRQLEADRCVRRAAAATASAEPPPPRPTWPWAAAGAGGASAGTGTLLAGQFCMPAVKRRIEIKNLKRNNVCHCTA